MIDSGIFYYLFDRCTSFGFSRLDTSHHQSCRKLVLLLIAVSVTLMRSCGVKRCLSLLFSDMVGRTGQSCWCFQCWQRLPVG